MSSLRKKNNLRLAVGVAAQTGFIWCLTQHCGGELTEIFTVIIYGGVAAFHNPATRCQASFFGGVWAERYALINNLLCCHFPNEKTTTKKPLS